MSRTGNKVGYGSPPREHQFQPGRSGNPSGRPKNRRPFTSDLRDELCEIVSITDGGKKLEVTKQRAIVKALIRKALKGEPRAIAAIVSACARAVGDQEMDEAPEDQAIMRTVGAPPTINSNSMPTSKSINDHE